MKLSITKITLLFILFISTFILMVHFYKLEEYKVTNDFVLNNYEYDSNFKLKINDSIIVRKNKSDYDQLVLGLMNTHFNFQVDFETDKDQVKLVSPFLTITIFYSLNDSLVFKNINITTTNKNYCEN